MNNSGSQSVPENKKGFTVNASPLNPVKLELGVIIILGTTLLLLIGHITTSRGWQLLLLGGFGCIAMLWLIVRARRVVRSLEIEKNG